MSKILFAIFTMFFCFCLQGHSQADWPCWRGSDVNSTVTAGVLDQEGEYSLEISWKETLGTGYSSISIVGKHAITMFSDGKSDYVICLDSRTGKKIWRFKIDAAYIGHNGSHTGPISTPFIDGKSVYCLGAKGQLLALETQTGKLLWSTHFVKDHKAKAPFYGYCSSPVVVGNVLLVEGIKTISGFDKNSGKLLWSSGDDSVNYQSPTIFKTAKRTLAIAAGDTYVYAIEPVTGKIVWKYHHKGKNTSLNPTWLKDQSFFLQHKAGESMLISVEANNQIKELWKTRHIKKSFNPALYHNNYFYGYSSRFLTCVDAKNGKKVWKSRKPGDGFAILVDNHLVVVTKKGSLYLVKASTKKYEEVAQLKLFKDLVWSPASFAGGKIFVRSHGEIAAVNIVAKKQPLAQKTKASKEIVSKFTDFVKEWEKTKNPQASVDAFIKSQKQFPIVEGKDLVHIVYAGPAEDVAIIGDISGYKADVPMKRVKNTNLFYFSKRLESNALINYKLIKDFDEEITDPLNKKKVKTMVGDYSCFAMPDWKEPGYLKKPQKSQGKLKEFTFKGKKEKKERKLSVYLPQGYEKSQKSYPVMYVHEGKEALEQGQFVHTLDNLIGTEMEPVIVVFIHSTNARELMFTEGLYCQMFVQELIPFIDSKLRTIKSPQGRANFGTSFAGVIVLHSTWKYPNTFGYMATESIFLLEKKQKEMEQLVVKAPKQKITIHLGWGKYDLRSPFDGWDFSKSNKSLAGFFKGAGYAYSGGEIAAGFGWSSWRNQTGKILKTFFPKR